LKFLGIEEKCIQTMKISTSFLKKGAAAGLTLNQIARKICREKVSEESVLEKLVALADRDSKDFDVKFGIVLERYFKGEALPGIAVLDEIPKVTPPVFTDPISDSPEGAHSTVDRSGGRS